jgi:hypothetical protein
MNAVGLDRRDLRADLRVEAAGQPDPAVVGIDGHRERTAATCAAVPVAKSAPFWEITR